MLAVVVAINVTHDAMYGPQAAWFAELFSTRLRYSGASLGYGIGSVIAVASRRWWPPRSSARRGRSGSSS